MRRRQWTQFHPGTAYMAFTLTSVFLFCHPNVCVGLCVVQWLEKQKALPLHDAYMEGCHNVLERVGGIREHVLAECAQH